MIPSDRTMRYALVIASKGRATVLAETINSLLKLQGDPEIIVVVTQTSDLSTDLIQHERLKTMIGPAGATFQRNAGIAALDLDRLEAVVFFDDDVEVHADYITRVSSLLNANPDIIAGSGEVLRDGDISRADARVCIANWNPSEPDSFRSEGRHWNLYGCNMFVRASALKDIRFDENLPSFAFAEDYEISIRLRRRGRVGRFNNAACVHLKTPGGRVNMRRVSYAMIANNFYFLRKGSVHLTPGLAVLRFFYLAVFFVPVVEFARRCKGVAWQDKLAWFEGCIRAWLDILTGRSRPDRVLDL